jgi:hypothetical protein
MPDENETITLQSDSETHNPPIKITNLFDQEPTTHNDPKETQESFIDEDGNFRLWNYHHIYPTSLFNLLISNFLIAS